MRLAPLSTHNKCESLNLPQSRGKRRRELLTQHATATTTALPWSTPVATAIIDNNDVEISPDPLSEARKVEAAPNPVAEGLAALIREAETLPFETIVDQLRKYQIEVFQLQGVIPQNENEYRVLYSWTERGVRYAWAIQELIERNYDSDAIDAAYSEGADDNEDPSDPATPANKQIVNPSFDDVKCATETILAAVAGNTAKDRVPEALADLLQEFEDELELRLDEAYYEGTHYEGEDEESAGSKRSDEPTDDEPDDTATALAAVKRLRAQLNRSFAVVSSARDSLERFISTDDDAVQIEPGDLELTFTLLDMAGEELGNVKHVQELERQVGGAA